MGIKERFPLQTQSSFLNKIELMIRLLEGVTYIGIKINWLLTWCVVTETEVVELSMIQHC